MYTPTPPFLAGEARGEGEARGDGEARQEPVKYKKVSNETESCKI